MGQEQGAKTEAGSQRSEVGEDTGRKSKGKVKGQKAKWDSQRAKSYF
jgi:hypothetical protein